jgi:hypothetical protein
VATHGNRLSEGVVVDAVHVAARVVSTSLVHENVQEVESIRLSRTSVQ